MASRLVKAAIVVGAAASLFGAYTVYDNLYESYRARDVPPVLGIFGAGLLVLGVGIGAWKHRLLGVLPLVLGAAYAGAMVKLGKQHRIDQLAYYQHEIDINKAAAAVCAGTPNTAASDAPINGKRPLLGAGRTSSSSEWFSGGAAWGDLPKPTSLAELQLVACTQRMDSLRATCDYVGKDGVGAHSISKYRRVDYITVRKAKTAEILGEQSFEGGEPSTDCSSEINMPTHSREASTDVTGDAPDSNAETAFVRSFVEQAK